MGESLLFPPTPVVFPPLSADAPAMRCHSHAAQKRFAMSSRAVSENTE